MTYTRGQLRQGRKEKTSNMRSNNGIFGLGIAEVVLGTVSIALEISALIVHSRGYVLDESLCTYPIFYALISSGIWCGTLAVITGTLGIVFKEKPIRAVKILNITMATITAVIMPLGIGLSGLAAVASVFCTQVLVILHGVIALLCTVLFITSIVHAALCCSAPSNIEKPQPIPAPFHHLNPYVTQRYEAEVNVTQRNDEDVSKDTPVQGTIYKCARV